MSPGGTPRRLWTSPVGAAAVAAGQLRFEALQLDQGDAYWIEGRPAEAGRCAVVRRRVGDASPPQDVTPRQYSARTFVHEYGGAALLAAGSHVVFSNAADGRLYSVGDRGDLAAMTPELGDVRYADMSLDSTGDALFCVMEDHRADRVVNSVARIPLQGGAPVTVVDGGDFYASPRVSPDGTRLCWLTWNQPLMPWDGTELWTASLDRDGVMHDAGLVAGGASESIFQPEWSTDSTLHFVSDRTGFWNLYRWDGHAAQPLAPLQADCGRPLWNFGIATYAFLANGRIALTACHDGTWRLHVVDVAGSSARAVELRYTSLGPLLAGGDGVVMLAGGPRDPAAIVHVDVDTGAATTLSAESGARLDDAVVSVPDHITFPGHAGETAHAWLYRPHNNRNDRDGAAPAEGGSPPPLLVHAHGGPTSAVPTTLNEEIQYWTSRGFAYVDVDYGGSTGYGRAYRERLNGQSGIVDVGDCVAAAQHLAATGEADGTQLFIEGGSAGGYIVLCAMTFHDVFAGGASRYGIADVELLFADTHKFEARYESPYPPDPATRQARSPVHFVDRVRRGVLLLQGLDDPIVPPEQSQLMYDALRQRGIPCAYVAFPGEAHGFRRAENIERTVEAELYFFCRLAGIEPPDDAAPVSIDNLPSG